jgi:hypothetical protein
LAGACWTTMSALRMHCCWRVSSIVTDTRCLLYKSLDYGSLSSRETASTGSSHEICRNLGEDKRGTLYLYFL